MPPINDDARVQGLHYLSVVEAARALVSTLASNRAYRDGLRGSPVDQAVETLVNEVNRLAMFERRASQRGTLSLTSSDEVMRAVKLAREKRDSTLEDRDAITSANQTDADALFDSDNLLGEAKEAKPAPASQPEKAASADPDLDAFEV